MPERKGGKICKATAENIRALVEASLKLHRKLPRRIAEIVRESAREDQETHEMYKGTGSPLDI